MLPTAENNESGGGRAALERDISGKGQKKTTGNLLARNWRRSLSLALSKTKNFHPSHIMRTCPLLSRRFRVLFVHLIPCVSLVILNILLFRTMKEAEKKRERLLNCR